MNLKKTCALRWSLYSFNYFSFSQTIDKWLSNFAMRNSSQLQQNVIFNTTAQTAHLLTSAPLESANSETQWETDYYELYNRYQQIHCVFITSIFERRMANRRNTLLVGGAAGYVNSRGPSNNPCGPPGVRKFWTFFFVPDQNIQGMGASSRDRDYL
jgi:hypothetical protein